MMAIFSIYAEGKAVNMSRPFVIRVPRAAKETIFPLSLPGLLDIARGSGEKLAFSQLNIAYLD